MQSTCVQRQKQQTVWRKNFQNSKSVCSFVSFEIWSPVRQWQHTEFIVSYVSCDVFFFLLLFALIWFFCLECRNGDWRLLIRQFKARINVRIKAEVGASELHKHLRVLDSTFTRSAYGLKANWRRLKLTRLGIDLTSWKKLSVRVSFFEGSPVRIAVWFLTQKLMSSRDARTSTNDSFVRFTCYVWILVVVVFVFSLLLLR